MLKVYPVNCLSLLLSFFLNFSQFYTAFNAKFAQFTQVKFEFWFSCNVHGKNLNKDFINRLLLWLVELESCYIFNTSCVDVNWRWTLFQLDCVHCKVKHRFFIFFFFEISFLNAWHVTLVTFQNVEHVMRWLRGAGSIEQMSESDRVLGQTLMWVFHVILQWTSTSFALTWTIKCPL